MLYHKIVGVTACVFAGLCILMGAADGDSDLMVGALIMGLPAVSATKLSFRK